MEDARRAVRWRLGTRPSSPAARSARAVTRDIADAVSPGRVARASTALGKTAERRRASVYRMIQLPPRRRDASWGIKNSELDPNPRPEAVECVQMEDVAIRVDPGTECTPDAVV